MPVFNFSQVNVFSAEPYEGNPLAVVHGAESLTDIQMSAIARWTNLSETTFLLPPTEPLADYRVRIFTPARELPFAGHPTLGSCYAWLKCGGQPKNPNQVIQQCNVGLVAVRKNKTKLEFAAPPLVRTGQLKGELIQKIAHGLGIRVVDIQQHQWVDNGPGWCAVLLKSAQDVLDVVPDWPALKTLNLGIVGPHTIPSNADFEVRAFIGREACEDSVTGSLNASIGQWLMGEGIAPPSYVASQGTKLKRSGRVYLHREGEEVWVGGDVVEVIRGAITV